MRIDRLVVGDLMVNCYFIQDVSSGRALVIDPGDEDDRILCHLKDVKARVEALVATHGHGDHIGGLAGLKKATEAPVWIGAADAPMLSDPQRNLSSFYGPEIVAPLADRLLREGDLVELGAITLHVLDVPGHSPGHIALAGEDFIFAGDVLFEGSVGRTDFPGGSMPLLIRMIREKLIPLGDECLVLPGHGPATTIGVERETNPFLQPGAEALW
ncbi:MAG: MBL fold metallo-hydrolase [Calditrichaeota bacterium]|nr:MBL fold metallo-hydrolase [Calditrichota bacterium]